eukprot:Skav235062  [mRNA]  locus=scaffold2047:27959:32573:+ [translate_table: standard]
MQIACNSDEGIILDITHSVLEPVSALVDQLPCNTLHGIWGFVSWLFNGAPRAQLPRCPVYIADCYGIIGWDKKARSSQQRVESSVAVWVTFSHVTAAVMRAPYRRPPVPGAQDSVRPVKNPTDEQLAAGGGIRLGQRKKEIERQKSVHMVYFAKYDACRVVESKGGKGGWVILGPIWLSFAFRPPQRARRRTGI